jgi:predicted amidohydrolase
LAFHAGALEDGERLIQPLRALGEPVLDLSGPLPHNGVQIAFDPLFVKGERQNYWKSLYLDTLDDDAIGRIVARYDKIHMFDVDLAGGESYCESAYVRPGARAQLAATPWGLIGMTVCYDLRFAQLYRALAQAGASFLAVPAAFTAVTGRAHWHVLLRARAIETGCFVFAPAQCGEHEDGRTTYGHSLIVSPWGEVLADGGGEVTIVTAEIDPAKAEEARRMIPALGHDRSFSGPGPVAVEGRTAEGE